MNNYYILIFIAALEFLIILFVWFSKSYSQKKGENQATKEDIGKITEIVEGIKKDLADNTEKLKADLALKNEHIISLRSIERESLINYYREIYGLINYLRRIDFTIYNPDNFNDIYNIKIDIGKEFSKCDLSQANVELFFDNRIFIEKSFELNLLLLKLSHIINKGALEYKYLLNSAAIQLTNKGRSAEIYAELHKKQTAFMEKFQPEKTDAFGAVFTKMLEVKKVINDRLKEILNK